jgi:hypothetical protein
MQRQLLIFVALGLGASGCYAPSFAECTILCGEDDRCPGGMTCSNGLCAHAPPTADRRADVYVGNDAAANAGAHPYCPYPSITAALNAVSGRSPVTIHVSPGVYDANHGERFPIVLRGALSLVGAGATQTIIEGLGAVDHAADQGAFVKATMSATLLVGDASATVRLSGLTVRTGLPGLTNLAYGVFCDHGNTPPQGTPVTTPGNTVLDGVTVGPGYHTSIVVTNSFYDGCNLTMTGSTVTGSAQGVWIVGCGLSRGSQGGSVAATIGDGGNGNGNSFDAIYGTDATTGNIGIAVAVWDCTQAVTLKGNQISNSGAGYAAGMHNGPPPVVFEGNRLINIAGAGIILDHVATIQELSDNVFQGIRGKPNSLGSAQGAIVLLAESQVLAARRNQIIANDIGLYIEGQPISASRIINFGTKADDVGDNVFRCNSKLDGNHGFDVWTNLAPGSGPIALVGNAWDHMPPSSATSLGAADGTDLVDTSAAPAPQLMTEPSARASIPCPAGSGTVE